MPRHRGDRQSGLAAAAAGARRIAALKSREELPALLAHDQFIGVNAFLNFGEQQDFANASQQIAAVDQGGLGLPERDYYLRTGAEDVKIRDQYVEHVANIFKLMGEPEAKAKDDAAKVLEMETALANASQDITSQRDPKNMYHMMTVATLQELAPAINWRTFLSETARRASPI